MYNLRLAAKSDYDFLYNLLAATLKRYYIEVFGKWDDDVEREYFDESFKENKYQIISCDGDDIGCLVKTTNPEEIFINEIQILPEYQNKGIGSIIITSIIEESENLDLPIKLEVLKTNEKAIRFYHRLNFCKFGENGSHIFMIRNPRGVKKIGL